MTRQPRRYAAHVLKALKTRGLRARTAWCLEAARAEGRATPRLARDAAFPALDGRGGSLLHDGVRGWASASAASARAAHEDGFLGLLLAGADVEFCGDGRDPPLVEAARFGAEPLVAALLLAGADPRTRRAGGFLPLLAIARRRPRDGFADGNVRCFRRVADALKGDGHLEKVAGWRAFGLTVLHYCGLLGHEELLRVDDRAGNQSGIAATPRGPTRLCLALACPTDNPRRRRGVDATNRDTHGLVGHIHRSR